MSHFSVVVCLDDKDGALATGEDSTPLDRRISERLEKILAPWDENREVTPYRDYEEGGPEKYWLYHSLKTASENERDGTGILPYQPDQLGWSSGSSKETPDQQRVQIAQEAALFRSLPEPVTWEAVIDMHKILYPEEEMRLLIDEEDGRAYTMSIYNPDSKWDYWRIGGRWGGYFTRIADSDGTSVIAPEHNWDSPGTFDADSCDAAPKNLIDLAAMRDKAAAKAIKTYQEYHQLVDHLPEALPWHAFTGNISENSGYTIDQARQEYQAQPRVQAVQGTDFQWTDDAVTAFGISLNLYTEKARAGAVPGFALVTADGRWMAPGRMGWWATTDATDSTKADYLEAANAYIDTLPDSTWLVAVDMHI